MQKYLIAQRIEDTETVSYRFSIPGDYMDFVLPKAFLRMEESTGDTILWYGEKDCKELISEQWPLDVVCSIKRHLVMSGYCEDAFCVMSTDNKSNKVTSYVKLQRFAMFSPEYLKKNNWQLPKGY